MKHGKPSKFTFSHLVVINVVDLNIGVIFKTTALLVCEKLQIYLKECTHNVSLPFSHKT